MIYRKAIEQITWDDIEEFCQQGIPEGAYLDYKQDFPSNLEKTIAAMANTLGGIILIGVAEDNENKPLLPLRGITFQRGISERVTNIILTNITPSVFPEIQICRDSVGDKAIVVIRIPQSHQTPHAISNNTKVYLRTGNRNNPEELGTIDDVEWLQNNRRKSEELAKNLYRRAHGRFANLMENEIERRLDDEDFESDLITKGILTFFLCPLYPKEPFRAPPQMNDVYRQIKVKDYYCTGYTFPLPDHPVGRIVQDGIILSEIDDDLVLHTELNSFGLYFFGQNLLRHYNPHGQQAIAAIRSGEIFSRLDQFFDSAIRLYSELGFWGLLQFMVELKAIEGVRLLQHRGRDDWRRGRVLNCPDSEIRFSEIILAVELEASKPQVILRAAQRIAWGFDWNLSEAELQGCINDIKGSV